MLIYCDELDINYQIQIIHSLPPMMRQKSMSTIREPLKMKTHLKSNPSLKKIEPNHSTKILHPDPVKKPSCLKHLSRDKQIKMESKGSTQKDKSIGQANSKTKVHLGVKTNINAEAMHIKSDLKNLINRMTSNRQKKVEVAGFISKNAQKHIKSTKNSNQKEPKQTKRSKEGKQKKSVNLGKSQKPSIIGNKRCSYQQTIQTITQKITISRNKTHTSHDEEPKTKKQQIKPTKLSTHGHTRYSLDSNPIGVKKAQIQQSLKIKPSTKMANVSSKPFSEDKNFMQIFKQYKKSFDVDSIKIEKSQKQDSLNTSQSRKVSSFLNSDRYATAPLLIEIQKQKLTRQIKNPDNEKGKVQQIKETNALEESQNTHDWQISSQNSQVQTIMREAISQISQYKQCSQNCRVDTANAEEQQAVIFGRNNLKFKKTIQIVNPKKPTFFETVAELKNEAFSSGEKNSEQAYQCNISKDVTRQFKLQREEEVSKEQKLFKNQNCLSKNPISKKIQQRQFFIEKESIEQSTLIPNAKQKDYESGTTNDQNPFKEEQHFKSSKYYVQPIPLPLFKKTTKSKQIQPQIQNQQLDVSLMGCEITLIQNNIIQDEGELAELQL